MRKHHPKIETSTPAKLLNESELGVMSDASRQAQQNKANSHEIVRGHAYQKWEAAGKPHGDGVNFWLEAEKECLE